MAHSEIRSSAGIPPIEQTFLYRQLRWLGLVIRMPDSRLPNRVLYDQLRLGQRSVGGQKKGIKDHIKSIPKKYDVPFNRLVAHASNIATWQSTCAFAMSYFSAEYDRAAALRRIRRHQHDAEHCPLPDSVHQCTFCGSASHALASSVTLILTLNDEEHVVAIRNGWTPEEVSQNAHN